MKRRGRDLRHKLEPPDLEADEGADEQQLFEQAMEGVRPLRKGARSLRETQPAVEVPGLILPSDVMQEAFQELQEVEWPFAPGYVEGGDLQWNRKLLRKLRNGGFSIQAELDLHGMTRDEAQQAVGEFLDRCSRRGLRCARIVHGQGHHSPRQVPVLKRKLPEWLRSRRNARLVAAFTSAHRRNGGAGATYVLLRKTPNRGARGGRSNAT